jgi:hypothetical protein
MRKIKVYEKFEDNRCEVVKPPASSDAAKPRVFLAGSIEQDRADLWQDRFAGMMSGCDVVLYNPRRDRWNPDVKQDMTDPEFSEQVSWELASLEMCDVVALYIDPSTKSPITLLELGLYAQSGKLLVCCPEGFYRKGNVDIVCARYGVPTYANLDELASATKAKINTMTCH